MKKELNEKIYTLSRKWALDTITNGLGRIEESDNRIICYVDKKRLKPSKNGLTIYCTGYGFDNTRTSENYNLNKQITYIFESIDFNNTVYLTSPDDVCVIFKNCTFNYDAYIDTKGSCVIMDSKIGVSTDIKIEANQLAISNSRVNSYGNIIINTKDHLHIYNSKIVSTNDNQNVKLNSSDGNLVIHNSNIMGDTVVISSPVIEANENSLVKARKTARFNSNSLTPGINCDTPRLVYNGRIIEKDIHIINNEKMDLISKREELLGVLRLVKDNIITTKQKELNNTKIKNLRK